MYICDSNNNTYDDYYDTRVRLVYLNEALYGFDGMIREFWHHHLYLTRQPFGCFVAHLSKRKRKKGNLLPLLHTWNPKYTHKKKKVSNVHFVDCGHFRRRQQNLSEIQTQIPYTNTASCKPLCGLPIRPIPSCCWAWLCPELLCLDACMNIFHLTSLP